MEKDYSLKALISFLDKQAERGHVRLATANALKASCNRVFSILDEGQKGNLATIDIEETFDRFKNLGGDDLSRDTLKTYRSRVKTAVSEFLKFKEGAEHWKPSFSRRERKSKQDLNGNKNATHSESLAADPTKYDNTGVEAGTLTHYYPLRADVTVTINGLPRDLKSAEAKRLAAFLQALCEDFEPGA